MKLVNVRIDSDSTVSHTIPIKYEKYGRQWMAQLRAFSPKLYQLLLNESEDYGFHKNLTAGWIAENRPCYFEGVTL